MKSIKRLMGLAMASVMVSSTLLTGCNSASKTSGDAKDTDKEVELSFYFPNTPQKDLQGVQDALNKLVKPKINATIKLNLVDWSAYDQKMSMMVGAGESFDLCFTSAWTNNYFQNAGKGAYKDLTPLIDKYAPKTKALVPDTFWKSVQVNGKTYAVPNFQQNAAGYGYSVQKPIADKYKFDWKNAKSWNDLTPLLEQVKKGTNLIPFEYAKKSDPFISGTTMYGMEALGDSKTPGWIYLNDKDLKVVNQYDTQEFKNYIKTMRDWYQKGYIRKDAATLNDTMADRKAGKYATQWAQIDSGTTDYEKLGLPFQGRMFGPSGVESYDQKFVEPMLTTDKATSSLLAISANSKNPERAMKFIELLNTDKEVYNTLCWGVEGKNYNKVGDNRIETLKDGGYQLWSAWEFGYMGNSYYDESWPKGVEKDDKGNKIWIDLNKNAKGSPALGFVFSMDKVKTEVANCNGVLDEFYYALSSGSVDPDKYQPELVAKLKTAGLDKILAEKQAQLDTWKKVNGK
ncbi:ABC transporter substrate-binding protein [Clostridium sp. YIM B02515]|uniref:ABC transporter substrate-binding protein n=1 Tax=Clostridium rhizosphaerae TaxID=2803861 RepID=A0ABS1T5K6_9CLOT|nr:ABC transporter substrate-binding protein [Clostridium rhizosphaerae]MBL4934619.1 ABC transporter substrate-binding protein [Clostridium rhizosphaerae]